MWGLDALRAGTGQALEALSRLESGTPEGWFYVFLPFLLTGWLEFPPSATQELS